MFVDLPTIGQEFEANAVAASIESVKAASDILIPFAGKITDVNPALEDEPELVNSSPENKGWFVKFYMEDPTQCDSLMDADEYEKLVADSQ